MKKILVIIDSLNAGGSERQLSLLIPRLSKFGFEIKICLISSGGIFKKELEKSVEISEFKSTIKIGLINKIYKLFSFIYRLSKFEIGWRPDIINYYLPQSLLYGGLLSFFFPKSIRISSRRGLNDYKKNKLLVSFLERIIDNKINYYMVNSDAVKRELREEKIEKERIKCIKNGIQINNKLNFKKIDYKVRKSLNISKNKIIISCVANLIPYKGHKELIEILSLLKTQEKEKLTILFIGKELGRREELINFASENNLGTELQILGSQKNIFEYIISSNIMTLLPTRNESLSNSILESMAFKKPSIVSDIGGNKELIKNSKNGFIYDIKDKKKFVNAFSNLIKSRQLRKEIGEAAHRFVLRNYSLDTCVESHVMFYNKIIECQMNK